MLPRCRTQNMHDFADIHSRREPTHALGGAVAAPWPLISRALLCISFSLFSCFINSLMPTGRSPNKSAPLPQFASLPPPSSSIVVAAAPPSAGAARARASLSSRDFAIFASWLFAAHSSSSSRYWSQTQLTQPDMQQLSGSVGRGGTSTPAIRIDFASTSRRRSPGPARREPKTMRAFSMRSSRSVRGGAEVLFTVSVGSRRLRGWLRSSVFTRAWIRVCAEPRA